MPTYFPPERPSLRVRIGRWLCDHGHHKPYVLMSISDGGYSKGRYRCARGCGMTFTKYIADPRH